MDNQKIIETLKSPIHVIFSSLKKQRTVEKGWIF